MLTNKEAVLKAKDRSTVMTGLTTGHPVRILENLLSHQYQELEFSGAPKEELEALGAGALRKAAIEGDVKNGSVMIGQISGMLQDVKPCASNHSRYYGRNRNRNRRLTKDH